MEPTGHSIPLPELPYDSLKHGLKTFNESLVEEHPIQRIQAKDVVAEEFRTQREIYGMAFPARMHLERQILGRKGRLPPLSASDFGADVYFGRAYEFSTESYLGLEEFSEKVPVDSHSQMEAFYGLGTKPVTRGII